MGRILFFPFYKDKKTLSIQVCWQIDNEDTRQREIKGLLKACRMTDSAVGIIFTPKTEEVITSSGGVKIVVEAAWKWLAQGFDLYGL